jgi:hypothetical protein
VALGSQKLFASRFRPIRQKINYQAVKQYAVSTTKSAYKVMLLWAFLIAVIGVLYYTNVINKLWLFMISVFFYVCDLICVLIWCPFRLIMKNKCCTTCRIYNWDFAMMFTPLWVAPGLLNYYLVGLSLVVFFHWEINHHRHPERFYEETNYNLRCSECKELMCKNRLRKVNEG